ncbi:DinB family protein [Paenibacillus arenilitoris]|uniref:DinB family protein n=1 Tax=Paenibacillus arenilitoris TaxID=2772299 RepID=A0A927CK45_9BACL|nr:DinB family protein [Paenibacillus arenilitoris]MBD2868192.1 DinB family protein [Paenibacillus arenilitoris]
MSQRPSKEEYHPNLEQYIGLIGEERIVELIAAQTEETSAILASLTDEQGDYRYAPGKWSLKEAIGHITDAERVMSYRLLRIARGDKTPLPGFDQDIFAEHASFSAWSAAQLLEDYRAVRQATLTLLRGLAAEAWTRIGVCNGCDTSARALAYVIAGHERHHLNIIREKYLNG